MRTSNPKRLTGIIPNLRGDPRKILVALMILLMTVIIGASQEGVGGEPHRPKTGLADQNLAPPQIKKHLSFHYEPQKRRDPFQPLVFPRQKTMKSDSAAERAIDQRKEVRLLGIMSGIKGYRAMVQNSEGKRYIVGPGSVIPPEGLKVKQISETDLEFEYLDENDASPTSKRKTSRKGRLSF